jgi:hypothetical protein
MARKAIVYDPSPELIWAVKYVVHHLLEYETEDDSDIKQEWLESLSPEHIWHPVRTLIEWLDREDTLSDQDEKEMAQAAAKASIEEAIQDGDLTKEAVRKHEIAQGVGAMLAEMSADDLERMAANRRARDRALAESEAQLDKQAEAPETPPEMSVAELI